MAGFPLSILDPAESSDAGSGMPFPGLGLIGDLIQSLISGNFSSLLDPTGLLDLVGVPKGAKTYGAAQSLESSGILSRPTSAPVSSALGGGGGSNVLSNPGVCA